MSKINFQNQSMSNFTYLFPNFTGIVRNTDMPLEIVLLGTISYVLIFIVGIIGNLITIYVLTRKHFCNFTNYLLANLSVADALTLFICIPTGLHDLYAKERWYFGRTICYLVLFFENTLGLTSILSILFISLERYLVVCCPLRAKSIMSQSRILKIMLLIWLTSIIINLPLIHMSELQETIFHDFTIGYKCIAITDQRYGQWRQVYSFFVTFVLYLIIGVLLVFMYMQITIHLEKSTLTLLSSTNATFNSKYRRSMCSPEGEAISLRKSYSKTGPRLSISNNLRRYIKPRLKLIFILKLVIVAFYSTLFPLKIWNLVFMFFGHKVGFRSVIQLHEYWYINITMHMLFYVNASINPILFNCLSSKFRTNCYRILSIRSPKEKNESNKPTGDVLRLQTFNPENPDLKSTVSESHKQVNFID